MNGLVKITIRVYARDMERLREIYPTMGYNIILRNLIHAHVSKIERLATSMGERSDVREDSVPARLTGIEPEVSE